MVTPEDQRVAQWRASATPYQRDWAVQQQMRAKPGWFRPEERERAEATFIARYAKKPYGAEARVMEDEHEARAEQLVAAAKQAREVAKIREREKGPRERAEAAERARRTAAEKVAGAKLTAAEVLADAKVDTRLWNDLRDRRDKIDNRRYTEEIREKVEAEADADDWRDFFQDVFKTTYTHGLSMLRQAAANRAKAKTPEAQALIKRDGMIKSLKAMRNSLMAVARIPLVQKDAAAKKALFTAILKATPYSNLEEMERELAHQEHQRALLFGAPETLPVRPRER